jgi:hypothetical protein
LDGTDCLGDLLGEDDPPLEHTVDLDSVLAHWDELDGQCQQLLTLRFYGNLTQDEISRRLGVSQMQVSRLLRRTLDYLRGCRCPPPGALIPGRQAPALARRRGPSAVCRQGPGVAAVQSSRRDQPSEPVTSARKEPQDASRTQPDVGP